MRLLTFDPGKSNFAYAIGTSEGQIETFGFIQNCPTDLTKDVSGQIAALATELYALVEQAKPDQIWAERFMYRPGKGMGTVTEFLNIALGVLACAALPIPVRLITSAQWKNHMTRKYWTSKEKFECRALLDPDKKIRPHGRKGLLTTHEADAIGILVYAGEQLTEGASLLSRVTIT